MDLLEMAVGEHNADSAAALPAIAQDGAQTALDSWQCSALTFKKKKAQRKQHQPKSGGADNNLVESSSTSGQSPAPKSLPSSGAASISNGDLSPLVATYGYGPPTADIVKSTLNGSIGAAVNGKTQRHSPYVADHLSSSAISNVATAGAKSSTTTMPSWTPPSYPMNGTNTGGGGIMDNKTALPKEVKNLDRHDSLADGIRSHFSDEIGRADARIRNVFQEIRKLLTEREGHLLAELQRCKKSGECILAERSTKAKELHARAARVAAMSDREIGQLRGEIQNFVDEQRYEEELGQATRFQFDLEHMVDVVKNFGEVPGIKSTTVQKHSSHSSLVSSVNEDSGLGMVSPVTVDNKKFAEVANGGISMKSDSFTLDQLEDLNRCLEESLRAKGIDASVLEGVGGSSAMPIRRRPNGGNVRGGGRGGGGDGGRGGGGMRQPRLSILQD